MLCSTFFAETWPKTASGLPSTAGTTASVAFIRRGKIYIGHVGDSAIVLGVQEDRERDNWSCQALTTDHKPESQEESRRIQESGGKVVSKSGVPRVVWNRPRMGHKGPVRRSTHIDEIPFLAVARSLGDLWSYNSEEDVFVVSPEPDTYVYPIDISKHRCLVLGTDGAWNMLSPSMAVRIVCDAEKSNEQHMLNPTAGRQWINPSKRLVDKAIDKWNGNNLRADNTSVVTVMLDPPGPPRAQVNLIAFSVCLKLQKTFDLFQVLKRQRELAQMGLPTLETLPVGSAAATKVLNADRGSMALVTNTTPPEEEPENGNSGPPPHPSSVPAPVFLRPPLQPVAGVNASSSGQHQPSSHAAAVVSSSHAQQQQQQQQQQPPPPPSGPSSYKGLSIISRYPNSRNRDDAQGQDMAESSSPSGKRKNHSVPNLLNNAPASSVRLTTASSIVDSTTTAHSRKRNYQQTSCPLLPSSSSSSSSSIPQPPGARSDDIQCNVVSSSDDDTPVKKEEKKPRSKRTNRAHARLSRELSALQLDSPVVSRKGRGSMRTRSGGEATTESEEEEVHPQEEHKKRQLRSSKKDVQVQCKEVAAKIKSMERKMARKVQNTLAVAAPKARSLRSGGGHQAVDAVADTPTTRSLRPRTPAKTTATTAVATKKSTPASSRKRKVDSDSHLTSAAPLAKSPKTTVNKQVVVTRSRHARVLTLRHK